MRSAGQSLACALAAVAIGDVLMVPASRVENRCAVAAIPQRDPANDDQPASFSVAAGGRFLAFASGAPLLPVDTNERSDIYVFDFATGSLTIETMLKDGTPSNADSLRPRISADGRLVVFESIGNLVSRIARDMPPQVLLRDRRLNTTTVLSRNITGELGNGGSANAVISDDGRVVAFQSSATNLLAKVDANGGSSDVFAVDVSTNTIVRASVNSIGHQASDGSSFSPSITADGRYIAFTSTAALDRSDATQPTPSPARQHARRSRQSPLTNVFVHDLRQRTTRRVSRRADGAEPDGSSYLPSVSGDGRYVAFVSQASDLVKGDIWETPQIYLHDLETSTTSLVSRSTEGGPGNGASTNPAMSQSGRFIAFQSDASDLVCSKRCKASEVDINLVADIFLFDRERGAMIRVSTDADSGWVQRSRSPALDANADVVVFSSRQPIDRNDRGSDFDLFVLRGCRGGLDVTNDR